MNANMFGGGAAISIALVSWGFYRLVMPKGWREWTRAGIVQAFIIAFYAEMYGFPVTIYLLARIFKLDLAGDVWDGNLWVYLTGNRWAMPASMTVGYTIAAFGVMLLIAGWLGSFYPANLSNGLGESGSGLTATRAAGDSRLLG